MTDEAGDTCSNWYDFYPEFCGEYDTDTFIANDLCCACVATSNPVPPECGDYEILDQDDNT